MSDAWQIATIADSVARISAVSRNGDLSQRVEHLNRWRVRDVVAHLGGVHRWATRILTERSMAGPGFKKSPLDGIELCEWFDEGAQLLLETLRGTELSAPCPNFNPGSASTVEWWARRQAHEATVHRWDVESAQDCLSSIAPSVAADGVDEFLDVFVRTRGKQTLASTLIVETTQPGRTWTLTPGKKQGRIDVTLGAPDHQSEPRTVVSGKPDALLLALWGRLSATQAELSIDGDHTAAAALLTL